MILIEFEEQSGCFRRDWCLLLSTKVIANQKHAAVANFEIEVELLLVELQSTQESKYIKDNKQVGVTEEG